MADHDPKADAFSPEAIRALRGARSRAEFARLLGITPLTIYRWELPEGAAEARRPRKSLRERIERLAADVEAALAVKPPAPTSLLVPAMPGQVASGTLASGTLASGALASGALESALLPHERATILPVLGDIAYANWQRAEEELMQLLSGGNLGPSGAALGQICMATIQLHGRGDVRGAFTTLLPALSALESGSLSGAVPFYAHTVAAMVFSAADGRLFDAGRVRAHVARAERVMLPHGGEDWLALLRIGQLQAALHLGDRTLFSRRLGRHRADLEAATQPMTRCLVEYLLSCAACMEGRCAEGQSRLTALVARAKDVGFSVVQCQALATLGLLKLESGQTPEDVLALCEDARQVARGARLESGAHEIVLAAVLTQARARQGEFAAAREAFDWGQQIAERLGWPAGALVYGLLRVDGALDPEGRLAAALSEGLMEREGGPLGMAVAPARALTQGLAALGEKDLKGAGESFAEAARRGEESGARPWLTRHAHALALSALVYEGERDRAHQALRRAERVQERLPGAWYAASLRWLRGVLLALDGRFIEADQQIEAALTAFQLAKDEGAEALARHALALVRWLEGGEGASSQLKQAADALQSSVIWADPVRLEGMAHVVQHLQKDGGEVDAYSLLVPVTRLAVRGLTKDALLQELVAVVRGLTGCAPRLEEIDAEGRTLRTLVAPSGARLKSGHAGLSFELGDGYGHTLKLVLDGEVASGPLAMVRAAVTVAGLALEVVALRSVAIVEEAHDTAPREVPTIEGIIAKSPAMRTLVNDVVRLANSRATVLISGESGTGKEVLARAIHQHSPRVKRPYVTFNCAAIPGDLFEGQLFGYRKGAFTGATSHHPGVIRAADGGTLFLDEIGDLPMAMQPKLLRFLENGEVFPLGDTAPTRVDVRVIAATHRDLEAMIRQGHFREDLFYRVQVVTLDIPPLRDREDDILALARFFIRSLTPAGSTPPPLSQDATTALLAYAWPGNVREVRNVIDRALAFSPLPLRLTAEHLRISG
ncbi:MAG: sigma 54-interacting transcriptional regulator [Deltaproteobacteria bacterium]|nr:sigma 54-interacting transcriptional regulator [Deltaproteobacteria bacterium]